MTFIRVVQIRICNFFMRIRNTGFKTVATEISNEFKVYDPTVGILCGCRNFKIKSVLNYIQNIIQLILRWNLLISVRSDLSSYSDFHSNRKSVQVLQKLCIYIFISFKTQIQTHIPVHIFSSVYRFAYTLEKEFGQVLVSRFAF